MIHVLLGIVAVAALGADSSAKPASAILPVPAPLAQTAILSVPKQFGKPFRLTPARINTEGKVVFRDHEESNACIRCVIVEKGADGKVTEGVAALPPFKPSIIATDTVTEFPDIRWLTLDGKPVDGDVVRRRLATWTPVLMLLGENNFYTDRSSNEGLTACFSPDVLVAAIIDKPLTTVSSPSNGKAAIPPIPILAHMDAKGYFILRPFRFFQLFQCRTKAVTYHTEKGVCTKQMCETTCHWRKKPVSQELAIEAKYANFFDLEGTPIEATKAAKQLAKETPVLLSDDGEKINRFFLKMVQPGTLTCVVPFRILEAAVPATVVAKACAPQKPSQPVAPSSVPVAKVPVDPKKEIRGQSTISHSEDNQH